LILASAPLAAAPIRARFTLDNDQFDFWIPPDQRPDFGYTHGTDLAIEFEHAPKFLARIAPRVLTGAKAGEPLALELSARQSIYVPFSLPGERPFAGWLGFSLGLIHEGATRRRELRLQAGWTGPPSGADQTQSYFHRHFDHIEGLDWSGQLPFEPGLELEFAHHGLSWSLGSERGFRVAAGPMLRARAGIPAIDLRLGLEGVAGLSPPAPWGSRRGSGPIVYVRAAPRLDIVLRDEFLAGTMFRESAHAPSEPLVPESELGIGLGWSGVRLEWSVIRRAKDSPAQPEPHTYGRLQLAWEALRQESSP
jgi:hypothetical protein